MNEDLTGKYTKMFLITVYVLCGGIMVASSDTERVHRTAMRDLYDDLFDDYNPNLMPVRNRSEVLKVNLSFSLIGINRFDEVSQTISTTGWLDVVWKDFSLIWNETDFEGINKIVVPAKKVWKPDITLWNFFDAMRRPGPEFVDVEVNSNGKMLWYPGNTYHTTCKVDVALFPFDIQKCSLDFGTWTLKTEQVNLTIAEPAMDLDMYQPNGEWSLLFITTERYDYRALDGNWSYISFSMTLKRRPTFFVLNTILPVILLSSLNILVFKLPAECGEKVSFSITVLLSFAVFLSFISDFMPRTSDRVSILALYLALLLLQSSLIALTTIVVLSVYENEGTKSVPHWLCLLTRCILPKGQYQYKGSLRRPTSSIRRPTITSESTPKVEENGLEQCLRFEEDEPIRKNSLRHNTDWKNVSRALDTIFFRVFVSIWLLLNAVFLLRVLI